MVLCQDKTHSITVCLISWTQSGPAGGLRARVGMQGSMKPLGRGVSMASLTGHNTVLQGAASPLRADPVETTN